MSLPKCDRCNKEMNMHRVSWFNTDAICFSCIEEEQKHPLLKKAKEVENEEVKKGNYNYPGIFSGMSWTDINKLA